ncbi:MAG TPA: hypothetical protein VJZ27_08700 [Aggregatilineales bacterium]|nr:hypothetical protein [Aggregatilineales bacterium]
MSLKSEWLIEQRVLLVTTGETFTAEELAEASNIIDPSSPFAYMIVDDQLMKRPPNIASFARARGLTPPENLKCVLSAGLKNPVQKFAAQMAGKLVGRPMMFFSDVPSAMEFIYIREPELRELAPEMPQG